MTLPVVTAIADPRWEADLVAGLARGNAGVAVVRRCVDVADLLATAGSGVARVVVLSADLRRLDRDVVTRLDLLGVAVVGLIASDDVAAAELLRRLGVAHVADAEATPAEVATVLHAAVAATQTSAGVPDPPCGTPAGTPDIDGGRRSRLVAVWGPTGAPGRTTVAIGVAAELAAAGRDVVLIDGDVYGGTVAPMLGLLDDNATFATACRLANAGRLDPASLAALAPTVDARLRVLTGIGRPERWDELRPSAVEAVLEVARALTEWVVVDCGFCLEDDVDPAYDAVGPRRNGATLSVLRAADSILAVGGADPVGLQRLVRGLAELSELVPDPPVTVVVNKVRPGVVGPGDPMRQIGEALSRYADVTGAVGIPWDPRATDRAFADARTLRECASDTDVARALRTLTTTMAERVDPSESPATPGRGFSRRQWRPQWQWRRQRSRRRRWPRGHRPRLRQRWPA